MEVNCSEPRINTGTIIVNQRDIYGVNDTIRYKCESKYSYNSGDFERSCTWEETWNGTAFQRDGTWNGTALKCDKQDGTKNENGQNTSTYVAIGIVIGSLIVLALLAVDFGFHIRRRLKSKRYQKRRYALEAGVAEPQRPMPFLTTTLSLMQNSLGGYINPAMLPFTDAHLRDYTDNRTGKHGAHTCDTYESGAVIQNDTTSNGKNYRNLPPLNTGNKTRKKNRQVSPESLPEVTENEKNNFKKRKRKGLRLKIVSLKSKETETPTIISEDNEIGDIPDAKENSTASFTVTGASKTDCDFKTAIPHTSGYNATDNSLKLAGHYPLDAYVNIVQPSKPSELPLHELQLQPSATQLDAQLQPPRLQFNDNDVQTNKSQLQSNERQIQNSTDMLSYSVSTHPVPIFNTNGSFQSDTRVQERHKENSTIKPMAETTPISDRRSLPPLPKLDNKPTLPPQNIHVEISDQPPTEIHV